MALRAGYYGLKRSIKNKLSILAASMPADIGPNNPIAGKNDVLASVDLLKDTVGWSGKNLLRFPYSEGTNTRNGITWTVNSDGTITANGTSTTDEVFSVYDGNTLPRDTPLTAVGGVSNNLYLYINGRKNGQWVKTYVEQKGEPKEFTILSTDDIDEIYVRLRINVNQTVNNLVFYPMICRSDEYALSPTYEPYHESVEEEITKLKTSTLRSNAFANNIAASGDLNTYLTPGTYNCQSSSIASGLSNCPTNVAFVMDVIEMNTAGTAKMQIIYTPSANYQRQFIVDTFSSWFKFTGTEVTPASLTKEEETKKATKKKVIKEEEE